MYKTGIETRESIIQSAKKFFYQYGYKKTTVKGICKDCGVMLGTFTYYFSRKEDMLRDIYSSYMESCRRYVDEHSPGMPSAQHHLYVVMLYYIKLYQDEHVIAFHREILNMGSMNIIFENPRAQIEDFSNNQSLSRDEKYYNLAVIADNAVRRELNINFINNARFSPDDVKNLLSEIYYVTGKLFGTDPDALSLYIEKSFQFVMEHPDAKVGLLR